MKAVVIHEIGKAGVEELPAPKPGGGQALLKVSMAGICGSDSSIYLGKLPATLPLVPGHEAIGRIEAVGASVSRFKIGDRVTVHPNYFCGTCRPCRQGLTNVCLEKIRLGIDINGVFAEYAVVPEGALYPIPDALPEEVAVFTEPLAVAAHGINLASPGENDRVLVFGAGVIGQLTLQLALNTSRDVSACDLVAERLALARKMGAAEVFGEGDPLGEQESSFDVIYETSGAPAALDLAIMLATRGGRIVLLGLPGERYPVSTTQIVRKELRIFGSMIYTREFSESIELLEKGLVKTEPLVSGIIPLEQVAENLERFHEPHRLKTLVRI